MLFEYANLTTKEYRNEKIMLIHKQKASGYREFELEAGKNIGVFINNHSEIIGINIMKREDLYSPNKIIARIKDKISEENPTIHN